MRTYEYDPIMPERSRVYKWKLREGRIIFAVTPLSWSIWSDALFWGIHVKRSLPPKFSTWKGPF